MSNTVYPSAPAQDVERETQGVSLGSISIGETLLFSLAFVAFFPYLKSSPLGSDVQPHYFAIFPAALFVFSQRLKALFFGAIYLAIMMGIGVTLNMSSVEMIGFSTLYVTVFLVSGADARQRHVLCWAIRIAMLVYVAGILAEVIGGGSVLERFVSNRRANGARGCCSFASEPSFLGFTGLAAFVILFKHGNRNWILDSIVPWLVMFGSGSTAAVIPGVLVIAAGNLRSFRSLFTTTFLITVLFVSAFFLFPESRFVNLCKDAYRAPATVLEVSSGANRFFRGVAPTYYGLKSGLRPHSTEELHEVFREFKFLRDDVRITRVSNLAGQLLFIFGVLSLPVIILYWIQFRFASPTAIAFAAVAVFVFSFSLVTTSTPYFHWMLGALLWPPATDAKSTVEPNF